MAFHPPAFNLLANVFTVAAGAHVLRLTTPANMAVGRAFKLPVGATDVAQASFPMGIFMGVPAGTDVRDESCGGDPDLIECPAGSGRFYLVQGVDDVGKGFPNEYRLVNMAKTWGFAGNGAGLTVPWPTPIP